MRVTVGIKAYNHETFVAQAIESALMQETNFPFEILIAEDFSTDRTRTIVEEFAAKHPERIRLFLPPANIGRHRIVQELCSRAQGEFVAIMDGDDFWTDAAKLQSQVDFMDAHPQCSTCFHDGMVEYDDGTAPHPYVQKAKSETYTLRDFLNGDVQIPTSAVLFRRGVFGDYPDWFFRLGMADSPMHILNAQHGDIGFIDRPMMVYRKHAGGLWSQGAQRWTPATAIKRYLSMIDMYDTIARHLGGLHQDVLDQKVADICHDMVWSQLCMGDLKAVRTYLGKARNLRGTVPNVSRVFLAKAYAYAYVPGLLSLHRRLRPGTFKN